MTESPDAAGEATGVSMWLAVGLQLVCWMISLGAFAIFMMRSMSLLADFGVEVSNAQMFIISISDWILGAWFISLPLLAGLVVGSNYVAFALAQSGLMRVMWTMTGCVIPFVFSGWMYLTIRSLFTMLHQELS